MNRIVSIALVSLVTMYANGADRFARNPDQVSLATTGRIVKVDARAHTLKVRGSDGQTFSLRAVSQNFAQAIQGLKQRIGVTLPGGITIALPGRKSTSSSKASAESKNDLEEYMVVTTDDTQYQDGGDSIQFEDFKSGDIISIHGLLSGNTLTASRIAKWF